MKKYTATVLTIILLGLIMRTASAAFDDSSALVMGACAGGMNGFSVGADFYGAESIIANPANMSGGRNIPLSPEISVGYSRLADGLSDGSNIGRMSFAGGTPLFKDTFVLGIGYDNLSLGGIYAESTLAVGIAATYKKAVTIGFSYLSREIKIPVDRYTLSDPVFNSNGAPSDYVKSFPEYIYGARINLGDFSVGYRSGFMDERNEIYKDRPADIVGIAYAQNNDFRFSMDYYSGYKKITALGIEKSFFDGLLFVRSGFASGERDYKKINAGFGLSVANISFDYAIDYPLSGLSGITGTHRIGMKMRFPSVRRIKETPATLSTESSKIITAPNNTYTSMSAGQHFSTAAMTAVAYSAPAISSPLAGPLLQPTTDNYIVKTTTLSAVTTPVVIVSTASAADATEINITPILKIELSTSTQEIEEKEKKIESAARQQELLPPPIPAGRTHKVLSGENLATLAQRYYGSSKEWMKIYKANEDKIEKGIIKPGSILIIP